MDLPYQLCVELCHCSDIIVLGCGRAIGPEYLEMSGDLCPGLLVCHGLTQSGYCLTRLETKWARQQTGKNAYKAFH